MQLRSISIEKHGFEPKWISQHVGSYIISVSLPLYYIQRAKPTNGITNTEVISTEVVGTEDVAVVMKDLPPCPKMNEQNEVWISERHLYWSMHA